MGEKKYQEVIQYAQTLVDNGKEGQLLPKDAFLHPICAKTFLRYTKNSKEIDVAPYSDENNPLSVLNAVACPIFWRIGDTNELITQEARKIIQSLQTRVAKEKDDISYLLGADHSYQGKEKELSEHIINFVLQNTK